MRWFDAALALAGVVVLSPLMAVVALAVKLQDGGPVLFRAVRVGLVGRPFALYKFRTMVQGANRRGPGITSRDDDRITPLGRLLRRYKLDELPQLFNVLRGDMALVGPRPEDPRYVALYSPEQRRVLSVRPGITSLASIRYRAEQDLLVGPEWERVYTEEILPHKLAIELEYLETRTFWQDFRILLRSLIISIV